MKIKTKHFLILMFVTALLCFNIQDIKYEHNSPGSAKTIEFQHITFVTRYAWPSNEIQIGWSTLHSPPLPTSYELLFVDRWKTQYGRGTHFKWSFEIINWHLYYNHKPF